MELVVYCDNNDKIVEYITELKKNNYATLFKTDKEYTYYKIDLLNIEDNRGKLGICSLIYSLHNKAEHIQLQFTPNRTKKNLEIMDYRNAYQVQIKQSEIIVRKTKRRGINLYTKQMNLRVIKDENPIPKCYIYETDIKSYLTSLPIQKREIIIVEPTTHIILIFSNPQKKQIRKIPVGFKTPLSKDNLIQLRKDVGTGEHLIIQEGYYQSNTLNKFLCLYENKDYLYVNYNENILKAYKFDGFSLEVYKEIKLKYQMHYESLDTIV